MASDLPSAGPLCKSSATDASDTFELQRAKIIVALVVVVVVVVTVVVIVEFSE